MPIALLVATAQPVRTALFTEVAVRFAILPKLQNRRAHPEGASLGLRAVREILFIIPRKNIIEFLNHPVQSACPVLRALAIKMRFQIIHEN